jgi:hypothetical protein
MTNNTCSSHRHANYRHSFVSRGPALAVGILESLATEPAPSATEQVLAAPCVPATVSSIHWQEQFKLLQRYIHQLCEKPAQQHLSAFQGNIYISIRISPTSYMNGLPVTVQEQILEVRGKSAKEISAKKEL